MKIDNAKIRYPVDNNKNQVNKVSRASVFTENFREEILNIPIKKLFPYSKQARLSFNEDNLENLAQTIKNHGIRQPLTVIDVSSEGEKYEVVSGERRLRAARIAGLDRLPCRIIKNAQDAVEISIIENLQREDLHPIEVARSLQALLDEGICKEQKDISKKVGLPKSKVSELLSYLKIPSDIQEKIMRNKITARDSLRNIRDSSGDKNKLDLILSPPSSTSYNDVKRPTLRGRTKKVLSVSLENGNLRFNMKLDQLSEEQRNQIFITIERALSKI